MYTKNVFAAGALLSVVAAVPMAKRDVVWVTETQEDIVTVPVTTTVWVNSGETIPTASSASHYGHHRSHVTTHVQSTVTVPAAPASTEQSSAESTAESSSSVYVAPSSYVAPTTSTTEAAPTTPSTTSSVYVAPTTISTSAYVAPTTPTSTWVAPTTSSAAPAATTSASSGSDSSSSGSALTGDAAPGTDYTGDLTWYADGLGACGVTSQPSDHIVAIAESLFDEYTPASGNPNDNPLCGKTVSITGVDGSPYTATIVDRCTGCQKGDLDLSEDFFNSVTNNGNGRVHNMSWKFD